MSDFPAAPRDTFALSLESQSMKSYVSTSELLAVFEARYRARSGFENSDTFRINKGSQSYGVESPEKTAKLAIATNCEIVSGKDLDPDFESGNSNAEVVSRILGTRRKPL